jgi:hypothetical protein
MLNLWAVDSPVSELDHAVDLCDDVTFEVFTAVLI